MVFEQVTIPFAVRMILEQFTANGDKDWRSNGKGGNMHLSRRHLMFGGLACGLALQTGRAQVQGEVDYQTEAEIADSAQEEADQFAQSGITSLQFLSDRIDSGSALDPTTKSIILAGSSYAVLPLTPAERAKVSAQRYWRLPTAGRPAPTWRDGPGATDYDHLAAFQGGEVPPSSFTVDHDLLLFMADRNAFALGPPDRLVVVGFRGCALANDAASTDWGPAHPLKLAVPNHVDPRCVIGLWDRALKRLRLFRASTVPEVANMYSSLAIGTGTSLLPTGLYEFRIGTHKASKPTRQPGALINASRYVVLRTGADLTYDPTNAADAWTLGAAHNIHAAGKGLAHPLFNSAGCQVIPGFYDHARIVAGGSWAEFRRSAKIVRADGSVDPSANGGGRYRYMLLTGVELGLAYSGRNDFAKSYRRLRPGSSGPRVAAAQAALFGRVPQVFGKPGGSPTGSFDVKTSFFALADQKINGSSREFIAPIMIG